MRHMIQYKISHKSIKSINKQSTITRQRLQRVYYLPSYHIILLPTYYIPTTYHPSLPPKPTTNLLPTYYHLNLIITYRYLLPTMEAWAPHSQISIKYIPTAFSLTTLPTTRPYKLQVDKLTQSSKIFSKITMDLYLYLYSLSLVLVLYC